MDSRLFSGFPGYHSSSISYSRNLSWLNSNGYGFGCGRGDFDSLRDGV